ncbi:hypothetical protein [Photobacterium lipolyticum]|uniref:DUF1579 domain-containing protein n=1 Tax=Photobacterium lipolyticum TaxID=266810 RepID=A0A2T3N1V7_9GAMM|nr:hypothetical protein [Photobacterium lipolyticum]PSW06174.1 hypothetical protein C9I89_06605 [Photobacterium lipolyticum]
MKQIFVRLVVLVFASLLMTTAASAQQSAEDELLNNWLGNWKSTVVFKQSEWFPEGKTWVESNDIQWNLDGHLQQIVTLSDEEKHLTIQRYNKRIKRYERWVIHASGDSSYWIGTWDEKSTSMNWEYMDFGTGFTGTMVESSAGEGKSQTTLIMKDKYGNVLLDGRIERVRTEQQKN